MSATPKRPDAFLTQLLSTASPSGFEQRIQRVVRAFAEPWASEVKVDAHGSLIASVNPKGSPRLVLMGHCDEIALQITHIDDRGYAYVTQIGGINRCVCVGQRVRILSDSGDVPGVIGQKPVHHMKPEERGKAPELKDLHIDIGAKDKADAEKRIGVGDPAVFGYGLEELANGRVVGRGVDNRIGVWVVFEAARQLAVNAKKAKFEPAVFVVSSVQEEIGLRGARTSAYGIDPHAGIAVDVGFASDYPGEEPKEVGDVKLGGGPILHRGANINPILDRLMVDTAKKKKLPYQMVAEPGGTGTDANAIQLTRAGVAAALVGIPLRYMHTTVETMDLADAENAAALIAETVRAIGKDFDFTPR